MSAPFGSLRSPLPPLRRGKLICHNEKPPPLQTCPRSKSERTQLIGQQVVWENVPRTQALAKCDWMTLTATGEGNCASCERGALNASLFISPCQTKAARRLNASVRLFVWCARRRTFLTDERSESAR